MDYGKIEFRRQWKKSRKQLSGLFMLLEVSWCLEFFNQVTTLMLATCSFIPCIMIPWFKVYSLAAHGRSYTSSPGLWNTSVIRYIALISTNFSQVAVWMHICAMIFGYKYPFIYSSGHLLQVKEALCHFMLDWH
jgi:hypothetical protein